MADLLLDNFQDVDGSLLTDHVPDLNLYGSNWRRTKGGSFTIITDPEDNHTTLLKVDAPPSINGGAITLGALDVQSNAIARSNIFDDKNPMALALRVDDSSEPIDYYGLKIEDRYELISIVKVVKDKTTVLAQTNYVKGDYDYDLLHFSVIVNTLEAHALNHTIQLGPLTDTQLNTTNSLGIFGGDEGSTGQYWKQVTVSTPEFSVEINDSAIANDTNTSTPNRLSLVDNGALIDNIAAPSGSIPIQDLILASDITILNETQLRLNDTGYSTEDTNLLPIAAQVVDLGIVSDIEKIRVNASQSDTGLGLDTKPPIDFIPAVNDNGSSQTIILGITFSILNVSETVGVKASEGELIHILVKANDISDSNTSEIESVIVKTLTIINDAANEISTINIIVDEVVILDHIIGLENIDIQNILPVINDRITDIIERINLKSIVYQNDSGVISENITAQIHVPITDNIFGLVGHEVEHRDNVYDFGFGTEKVIATHFEIQLVSDNAMVNDFVSNIIDKLATNDTGLTIEQISASIQSQIIDLFIFDDIISVVPNVLKMVIDQGNGISSIDLISAQVVVDDISGSYTSVGLLPNNTTISDIAAAKELHFAYKGDQRLVNVLFTLRKPRVLFTLNTEN